MPDPSQPIGGKEASISPEIADYFGVESSPASQANSEKVNSGGQESKQTDADKTKENASEEKKGEVSITQPTEEKKTPDAQKKEGEGEKKETETPSEFEVAGTKYNSIQDAIKAINRINGANSQMAGDIKSLKQQSLEAGEKLTATVKLLEEYRKANEEWQKYYDEGGEKPDNTKMDLEAIIDKKLEEKEQFKKKNALQLQFAAELDEIFKEPDFDKNLPFFKELMDEYDGVPNVSPKKLYERAKILAKKDSLKDVEDIEKMAEDIAIKKLAQIEAKKGLPNSGGSNPSDPTKGLSPEIADYFLQRI